MTQLSDSAPPPVASATNVAPPTIGRGRILALAWGAWASGFASLMLMSFLLGRVQAEFGLSERALAGLTGLGVGMTGVGGFLFGWIADRKGRRLSLGLAVVLFSAGNLLCAAAPSGLVLALGRALAGLGIGGTWGGGQALVGETFPPALRGRYGAIAQSGAPIGLGLATILGSFIAPIIGWRASFVIAAFPAIALLFWKHLPESNVWLAHRDRLPSQTRQTSVFAQLLAPDLASTFVRAFLLTAFNMSAYWFALIWLPRILQEERGLTIFGTGWWTLAFVLGSLVGYLTFGWASDHLGRRPAFTLYCAVTALGLALVVALGPLLSERPALGLAALLIAGLGTGTWSCFGPYFSELFPTRVRGTAMSVIMNTTRGIQFLAPIAITAVADRFGLVGGIAFAAAFAVLAGAWVWTLPETVGTEIR